VRWLIPSPRAISLARAFANRPLPYAVLHISEFLAQLKREGRLKLKPLEGSITYHDPCQISRRGGARGRALSSLGFRE
jgi:Fe-S oxidoreductase